ncbi:RING-H2 finger protein ATL56-like [Asparagus officinalis]|uniref:RING-H2 finger protein ATL56-like n=1 Tax=Asparagus officinalis TaxID=4686 RepID=UPI00098E71FC|nr:RING-H2 finger protein ATL56-like [Asparagus officinalis]
MKTKLVGIAVQILVMAIIISIILLLIGIGVLAFVHVCVLGRRLQGRNFNGDDGDGRRRERSSSEGSGLSNDDLKKLPCYYYAMRGRRRSASECAVCLEVFEDGDKCRMLPQCEHSFHVDCVDSWLLRAAVCPTCRASVDIICAGKGGVELENISEAVGSRGEH